MILFTGGILRAQNYEDLISRYSGANGDEYMQPIADVLGANINSGMFHSAYIQRGITPQFYIGLTGMVAFIPDASKVFTTTTEGEFFPTTTVEDVPTIFGDKDGKTVEGPGGTRYYFPGGLELDAIPLALPQITVGSIYGTDITVRYMSVSSLAESLNIQDEDLINELHLFGWGVRHCVSQYFEDFLPVDISVGYYRNTLSSGEYLNVASSLISIQASYNKSLLTIYGGIGIESSSTKVYYDFGNDFVVNYNLKGRNTVRLTVGATVNAGPLKINVDYNVANQSTLSAGIGIGVNELKKD